MTHATFAGYLQAAHNTTPTEIFASSCSGAVGPNGLLHTINDAYNNAITKLSGSTAACALTGNGNQALANAAYRSGAVRANNPDNVLYSTIVNNISAKWTNALYPNTNNTYQAECQNTVANLNNGGLPAFIATVLNDFSQPPLNNVAANSTNYLDLVRLNTGGNAFLECGHNPAGNGPVNCP
jgi:hypothetical protein